MFPEFSYAEYVWAAYGFAALVLIWQTLQPFYTFRRLVTEIKKDHVHQGAMR
jgi:heme exporter protein CcmD